MGNPGDSEEQTSRETEAGGRLRVGAGGGDARDIWGQDHDRHMHCDKSQPAVCATLCLIFCLEKSLLCPMFPFILCVS